MNINKDDDRVQELLGMSTAALTELYLNELCKRRKAENEASWLDQLADLLRDMDDDFSEKECEIREEYNEIKKQNKELENKYFIDLEKFFVKEHPSYEKCGFLVDDRGEVYHDQTIGAFIYDNLKQAQEDSDENFSGEKKAVEFSGLSTLWQWEIIYQIRDEKEEL